MPKNKRARLVLEDIISISAHVNDKNIGVYKAKSTNITYVNNGTVFFTTVYWTVSNL